MCKKVYDSLVFLGYSNFWAGGIVETVYANYLIKLSEKKLAISKLKILIAKLELSSTYINSERLVQLKEYSENLLTICEI